MPFVGRNGRVHPNVNYMPFGPPPDEPGYTPQPIEDGVFKFSSSGLSIKGTQPKRPSEIVAAILAQYEQAPVRARGMGQERGGPGKKKGKVFFQAHLTWYGIDYPANATKQELQDTLYRVMTSLPPPQIPEQIFRIEAAMRVRYADACAEHTQQVQGQIQQRLRESFLQPTGLQALGALGASTTARFFDDPHGFCRSILVPGGPEVIVLSRVHDTNRYEVFEVCADLYRLSVIDVMTPGSRGNNYDMVIGKSLAAVRAEVARLRASTATGTAGTRRYAPYLPYVVLLFFTIGSSHLVMP